MLNLSNSDLLIKGQKLAALTKIFVPKVFLLTPAATPLDSRELWFAPDPASPLPTVGWLVTTQLAAHLRSIPHLLSADQQANFICHMSFYGGRLIGKRLPPHHSASVGLPASQPTSNILVKPLRQLVQLGWQWQSMGLRGSHLPAGAWGYLWVPLDAFRYF